MNAYRIVNIQEILLQKNGVAYKGEIGVFVSDKPRVVALAQGNPVYVNAFSYMLVLRGDAELSIDERIYTLTAGMLCLISPLHLTSFVRVSATFQSIFLCIHKNFVDHIRGLQVGQRITIGGNMHLAPVVKIGPEEGHLLRHCIDDVRRQIERQGHTYHLELIQNALVRFYLEVDNILEHELPASAPREVQPRQVQLLREFFSLLMNHYKEQHQVAFYADAMHISCQYLTATVRRQTGKTVNTFIFELLYSEARNLLSTTDLSIQQIAAELRFADQASFSKFFKRCSGMSPFQFRTVASHRE